MLAAIQETPQERDSIISDCIPRSQHFPTISVHISPQTVSCLIGAHAPPFLSFSGIASSLFIPYDYYTTSFPVYFSLLYFDFITADFIMIDPGQFRIHRLTSKLKSGVHN